MSKLIAVTVVVATGLWPVHFAAAFHAREKRPTGPWLQRLYFINSLWEKGKQGTDAPEKYLRQWQFLLLLFSDYVRSPRADQRRRKFTL